MAATHPCQRCGAQIAPQDRMQGMCPSCLLELGLREDSLVVITGAATAPAPPPSPEELAPLFPQFEILSVLGQGGMGVVYKARQKDLDRLVALKVLPASLGRDPAFAERFSREAKALASLSHPNLVAVHNFGKAGEHFWFAMELVDGVNLRQLIQSEQMKPARALQIVGAICEALAYAHSEGVVHRDIKPENILIDAKGRLKITDFGLAKIVRDGHVDDRLTMTHQAMGTPHYMAPEQVEHPNDVDHRADIFSLGVVFYELLTGELPLGRFPNPSQKFQLDVRLDDVVLKALQKEPALRYQTVGAVQHDVSELEHPAKPKVEPAVKRASAATKERATASSRSVWPWVLGLGCLGFLLLGGFLVLIALPVGLAFDSSNFDPIELERPIPMPTLPRFELEQQRRAEDAARAARQQAEAMERAMRDQEAEAALPDVPLPQASSPSAALVLGAIAPEHDRETAAGTVRVLVERCSANEARRGDGLFLNFSLDLLGPSLEASSLAFDQLCDELRRMFPDGFEVPKTTIDGTTLHVSSLQVRVPARMAAESPEGFLTAPVLEPGESLRQMSALTRVVGESGVWKVTSTDVKQHSQAEDQLHVMLVRAGSRSDFPDPTEQDAAQFRSLPSAERSAKHAKWEERARTATLPESIAALNDLRQLLLRLEGSDAGTRVSEFDYSGPSIKSVEGMPVARFGSRVRVALTFLAEPDAPSAPAGVPAPENERSGANTEARAPGSSSRSVATFVAALIPDATRITPEGKVRVQLGSLEARRSIRAGGGLEGELGLQLHGPSSEATTAVYDALLRDLGSSVPCTFEPTMVVLGEGQLSVPSLHCRADSATVSRLESRLASYPQLPAGQSLREASTLMAVCSAPATRWVVAQVDQQDGGSKGYRTRLRLVRRPLRGAAPMPTDEEVRALESMSPEQVLAAHEAWEARSLAAVQAEDGPALEDLVDLLLRLEASDATTYVAEVDYRAPGVVQRGQLFGAALEAHLEVLLETPQD